MMRKYLLNSLYELDHYHVNSEDEVSSLENELDMRVPGDEILE